MSDSLPVAMSTYNMYQIINGIRTAFDFGVAAPTIIDAARSNGTITTSDGSFNAENVLIYWASAEWAFFSFTFGYLILRYCFQIDKSKLTPGAQNVMLLRIVICAFSCVAAVMLSSDLAAKTGRSVVGIAFIFLTTILSSTFIEKFEKQQQAQEQANQHVAFFGQLGIPAGWQLNYDHVYTAKDMHLAFAAMFVEYSVFRNHTPGQHFLLARSPEDDLLLLVVPPHKHSADPASVVDGLGQGNLAAWFDHVGVHGSDIDVFSEIANEMTLLAARNYRILMPVQGLDAANPSRWSLVEIKIAQTYAAPNHTYIIEIYNHSPYGAGTLTPGQYGELCNGINTRLTAAAPNGLGIPQASIHYRSQTDITANSDAANIIVANLAALSQEDVPKSSYTTARLALANTNDSAIAVLNDAKHRLENYPLPNRQLSTIDIERLRNQSLARVLRHFPEPEHRSFKNRSIVPVRVAVPTFTV